MRYGRILPGHTDSSENAAIIADVRRPASGHGRLLRRRFLGQFRVDIAGDADQFAEERRTARRAAHQHAAAILAVFLARDQVELHQPVHDPGHARAGNMQQFGKAADRVRLLIHEHRQERGELARRQITAIATHECQQRAVQHDDPRVFRENAERAGAVGPLGAQTVRDVMADTLAAMDGVNADLCIMGSVRVLKPENLFALESLIDRER